MPSVINQATGATTVGANYRRAFAPFTRFNTRKLGFFEISLDLTTDTLIDEELGGDNPNPYFEPTAELEYEHDGYFQRAIQAIETRGEIYAVYRPGDYYDGVNNNEGNDGNTFIVVLAIDTANVGSDNEPLNDEGNPGNYNDNSGSIADAVSDACDCDVNVNQLRLRGSHFRFSDLNGLETNNRSQAVAVASKPRG
jgi:hypothetical protein